MTRTTAEEALRLWHEASDDELKELAQRTRARWHEPDKATYMIMRIVNYTNVCVAQCDYCAFYVLPNQEGGYVLDRDDVFAKIDELLAVGGDLVGFNGGFNPKLPLDYYCDLFASVRERYGDRVEFYALTVAEFVFLADRADLSFADAASRLRDAGVHWITGGGSEILTEDFRQPAREVEVHRRGLLRRAAGDRRERDAHDGDDGDRVRRDDRGADRAPAADTGLPGRVPPGRLRRPLLVPLLDVQALRHGVRRPRDLGGASTGVTWRCRGSSSTTSRHMRTSVLTQNEEAFRALQYGADDFDLPIEDEVTQKAGARVDLDLEGLLDDPSTARVPRRVPPCGTAARARRLLAATRRQTRAGSTGRKRSSGTWASSPTSRAISRNV